MTLEQQKEQFSFAYVRAVAAVAQVAVTVPEIDDDSIDLNFRRRGGGGRIRSPQVDAQIKCTSGAVLRASDFSFALDIKNYDELRPTNVATPRILVVVTVDTELTNWLTHSETELAIRRCGYWLSLRGMPDTTNTTSISVQLPRAQKFNVEQLSAILDRVATGGMP